MNEVVNLSEYRDLLGELKQQIKTSQIKASISVNSRMIMLYWDMGRQIVEKQENAKWGSGFIEQLSKDLKAEFPKMKGFSEDNLAYMKKFYLFYTQISEQPVRKLQMPKNKENIISEQVVPILESQENVQQDIPIIAFVPWGHHIKIMQKVKDVDKAVFYINKTIENNWSRAVLEYQIENNLYGKQGKAVTNFSVTLPEPQSDLANEMMKDPYNFDFLQLSEKVRETDLEIALIQHISQFLPELGIGFAYMGRQYTLKVGDDKYRTDLLFYHTRLKCYVVIELKMKKFEPEFIGRLNFYISTINELVRDTNDNPTIGMLLCKDKNNYAVEFSLKDVNNPIGVSTFHYTELADEIKSALPTAEVLQNELLKFEQERENK
jgi:predicted nuclease of restriction endonuclease-like (RecB) superfamily